MTDDLDKLGGEPFKGFSEDYYSGWRVGHVAGKEEGRRELAEELRNLLGINQQDDETNN